MLVIAIANEDFVPINRLAGSIKAVVEGKIIETLTNTRIGDAKKVFTRALPIKVEDNDNITNNADINEMAILRCFIEEVGVWLVPVVVIIGGKSTIDIKFTINSTISVGPLPIIGVGISIIGVFEGKIWEILTWARTYEIEDANNKANGIGADKVAGS